MSRLEPKNTEEAFTYQFEDDVKVLRACSHNNTESFMKQLRILKIHIQTCEKQLNKNYLNKVKNS